MFKKSLFMVMAVFFIFGMSGVFITAPAMAQTIELKLAHFMPTMHVQHREAFEPFVEKVAKLSNGEVKIKIYPGATLGNPKTMVRSISTGITDIGFVLPSYVPGRFPRSSVFELPFICKGAEHTAKVFYDNYEKYLAEDYKDYKVLWFLSSPLSQCYTVKKAVKKAADFKGLRIRTGGEKETAGIKLLGGNPVSMTIDELSISLQKGVVDGAFTAYAAMKSHKLIDVAHYVTEINYSGAIMGVLMNKKKWDSLPGSAKKVIDEVANKEFGLKAAAAFDEEDRMMIKAGKDKGIQFYNLSDAEMGKIRDKVKGIYSDWINKNSSKFQAGETLKAVQASAKAID